MRVVHFQGIENVRDLGGIAVEGGRTVKPGLMFRGGALVNATADDCDLLFNQLGISCVVDVRTGWEREAKPDVTVEGVENLHIPFYDFEKVGVEYTKPAEGTIAIGRDVACEPDDYYRSLANPLTVGQMRKGVNEIFTRAMRGQSVYQHCSGGKDRAGIMALLLLTVLGASREDILDDYLFTNESRDKRYAKMFERFLRLADGNEERAHELVVAHRARPENLDAFYEAIDERYGSMPDFVREQLGIDDAQRERIREACTVAR